MARRRGLLLLAAAVAAPAAAAAAGDSAGSEAFEAFAAAHGKRYEAGSDEYAERARLYARSLAEVTRHNQQPGRRWTAAVGHLGDWTEEELAGLRGYRRQARPEGPAGQARLQLLGEASRVVDRGGAAPAPSQGGAPAGELQLPPSFSWREQLSSIRMVQEQRSCGSCWAFAATKVLHAHAELYQGGQQCSVQQVVTCTPNPRRCGGSGGCLGATAELALEYVMQNGCVNASEWVYSGSGQASRCPAAAAPAGATRLLTAGERGVSVMSQVGGSGLALGLTGYRKLPENELNPLMLALYQEGPVAVSLSAGRGWNHYASGIMDACARDAVINHAVVLVGYGAASGHGYWLILNSWGQRWGEGGFIRLQRRSDAEEAAYCGWDHDPGVGSGCRGGPPEVEVCGSCGILYDAVVPIFERRDDALWSRLGRERPLASPPASLFGGLAHGAVRRQVRLHPARTRA